MKRQVLFSFALFISTCAFSQSTNVLIDYFVHRLTQHTKDTNIPDHPFSLKKIGEERERTWAAWRSANEQSRPYALAALDSLGKAQKHAWTLPDSLEPNATMNYYYGAKGKQPTEGYPLYFYLHGSGPREQEWQTGLALAKRFADAPSVYFIPQIPNTGEWYRWWQRSKQLAWRNLLREALLSSSIDVNRLYVFGISEGGYGSQRLASFYADYWAAAGPMAGGEPLRNAPVENLGNIGFSFRTGANDAGFYRNTLTRYTQQALDSIQQLYPTKYPHNVELIPGREHFIDYSPTTPWLSKYTRNAHPHHFIWEDFEMDGAHRNGFYNLIVGKRPDSLLRTRYEVNINNNVVNISIDNVRYTTTERDPYFGIELKCTRSYEPATGGSLWVMLDEQLVNLKKTVTVKVNGKEFVKVKPKLNVKHMLRSLSTFYDPERIYPTAIKVDY